jgi:BMFP domain-containing protein YqiC
LEARTRNHRSETKNFSYDRHSTFPYGSSRQAGQVFGYEVKKLITATLVGTLLLTACGSSDSSGINKDHAAFCALAKDLETASAGPHGEDPAAITDPMVMKEVWTNVTALSKKMADGAPSEVKTDVKTMISGIIAMNDIFSANGYDLQGMAKDVKVREELAKISNDSSTLEASQRFQKFMTKNCGISAN